ncbi:MULTISPECIES: hypothetical protein [Streptomyces]|uniref:DUF5666 domain-containing protein n=4 Tax=Streptomyces TaxID=1883 RepID=A0A8H9HWJ1_9ACTN|nr:MULTISPECIES: hypothetical protein [Streptomyces]NEE29688.1 hypothetical protein [Streptomyces sp. SID7982]NEE48256.1 hypothetical protein [Streptomyces sp. SID8455]MBL3807842.1 hypothetical protein [Streptomyces sp. BRB081]MDQ0296978.1 hypothetical protein [Streptomyces sp. DSM 41037]NEC15780.1 hypothetical protein [Streptomyces sp. SID8014]
MIRRIAITLAGVGAAAFLAAAPAAAHGGSGAEFEVEGWKAAGTVVKVGDIFVGDFKAAGFEAEAEFTRR